MWYVYLSALHSYWLTFLQSLLYKIAQAQSDLTESWLTSVFKSYDPQLDLGLGHFNIQICFDQNWLDV